MLAANYLQIFGHIPKLVIQMKLKRKSKICLMVPAPFDTPKPVRLLDRMLTIATDKDSIVLDFFSGSATTAHAVMRKNAQDGGHRKFILVQLSEKSPSPNYETICDIGKERIRRAGDKAKRPLKKRVSEFRKLHEYKNRNGSIQGFNYSEWGDSPEIVKPKKSRWRMLWTPASASSSWMIPTCGMSISPRTTIPRICSR